MLRIFTKKSWESTFAHSPEITIGPSGDIRSKDDEKLLFIFNGPAPATLDESRKYIYDYNNKVIARIETYKYDKNIYVLYPNQYPEYHERPLLFINSNDGKIHKPNNYDEPDKWDYVGVVETMNGNTYESFAGFRVVDNRIYHPEMYSSDQKKELLGSSKTDTYSTKGSSFSKNISAKNDNDIGGNALGCLILLVPFMLLTFVEMLFENPGQVMFIIIPNALSIRYFASQKNITRRFEKSSVISSIASFIFGIILDTSGNAGDVALAIILGIPMCAIISTTINFIAFKIIDKIQTNNDVKSITPKSSNKSNENKSNATTTVTDRNIPEKCSINENNDSTAIKDEFYYNNNAAVEKNENKLKTVISETKEIKKRETTQNISKTQAGYKSSSENNKNTLKFCPKCGNRIVPGTKFCTKCGLNVELLKTKDVE